jgi:hypothetical protein
LWAKALKRFTGRLYQRRPYQRLSEGFLELFFANPNIFLEIFWKNIALSRCGRVARDRDKTGADARVRA